MTAPLRHAPHVAVMGGSLGGLTAALLLRDAGCTVDVHERSRAALSSRGAGIVSHDMTLRYITRNRLMDVDAVTTSARWWRYVDGDGAPLVELPCQYRFTSWNSIHKALLSHFPPERYRLGSEVTGFDDSGPQVRVTLADGTTLRCDLLVCADGVASTARPLLLPGHDPQYAGYVGWRGVAPERDLSDSTSAMMGDAINYRLLDNSHILTYPIPNYDGDVRPGRRLINFVWYRNVPEGPALDELLTDVHGERRALSVPPGAVRKQFVIQLRDTARETLPPAIAEVVTKADEPFIQPIFDLEVPRMAFGRIALLGDAAFTARPHAAAGTAKAAADAWALHDALVSCDLDVAAALQRWEPGQLELGSNLVARSRRIGQQSQFEGSWDIHGPTPFGLYGPGR